MRNVSFSCVFNFFRWKSRLEKSKKVKVPGATEPQPVESSVIQSIPRNFYLGSCSERAQVKEYEVRQSKYKQCGKLPTRSVLLGPSHSGKTVLLQNLILKVYRGCFERIYVFSPSIMVDATWEPVKQYIEEEMDAHETEDGPFYFDSYKPCLLYTSPSPRDAHESRMPSSA